MPEPRFQRAFPGNALAGRSARDRPADVVRTPGGEDGTFRTRDVTSQGGVATSGSGIS